jgi:hypothetical protein
MKLSAACKARTARIAAKPFAFTFTEPVPKGKKSAELTVKAVNAS